MLVEDDFTKVTISKKAVSGENELEGATIQVLDSKGNVVTTVKGERLEWVSGTEPKVIEGLKAGEKYTLKETVAPDGYTIASTIDFTIDENGNVTAGEKQVDDGIILIEDAKTVVKVSKVEIAGGPELEGATIQVLEGGKVVEIDGKKVEWVSAVDDETTTDVNEAIHEIVGLKTGVEYTLRETVAPEGYAIATDTTFTIDETGKVITTGTMTEGGVILVEDALTKVSVSKVAVGGGEEIAGAQIQLMQKKADSDELEVVKLGGDDVAWTSAADDKSTPAVNEGVHDIVGLKPGDYVLRETVAPAGYAIATDIAFTLNADGTVTTTARTSDSGAILVEDDLTTVSISKVDIADGFEVAGAKMQVLYRNEDDEEGRTW